LSGARGRRSAPVPSGPSLMLTSLGSRFVARFASVLLTGAFTMLVIAHLGAQNPPQPQRGRGEFPAQQRAPADPAVVARGKALFDVSCALCHGADLRGGQLGGVNLLRSLLVLNDRTGELILPIVRGARAEKGMPPIPMPDEDVKAVAEYIHSVIALSPHQGMPPPGATAPELNLLVGDPAAGAKFFAANCAACHSAAGDLNGIATKVPDAKALQNLWVSGGLAAPFPGPGRGGRGRGSNSRLTVTVTLPSGEKVEGALMRIDDFYVALRDADGSLRSFTRKGAVPKVEIHDPLDGHRALLAVLTDVQMHDVTAYLATLK